MSDPTSISNLKCWFRSDVGAYKDAAKTLPCSDGDPVYTWADQQSVADAIESNSTFQPVYKTTGATPPMIPTMPRLVFSGNKALKFTTSVAEPLTSIIVANELSIGNTSFSLILSEESTAHQITHNANSSNAYQYNGAVLTWGNVGSFGGKIRAYIAIWNGASSFMSVNGVVGATGSPGASTTLANLVIMNAGTHTYYMNGDVYEVCLYSKALSLSEISTLMTYFSGRYPTIVPSGAVPGGLDKRATVGLRGIQLGSSPTSFNSDHTLVGHLRSGVTIIPTDGSPSSPCLSVGTGWFPTFYSFQWGVSAGANTLTLQAKQASNVSPRPTIIIRKNPSIGINSDVVTTVGSGTGWISIGPITVTPSAEGTLVVELWNNTQGSTDNGPALFDSIEGLP